MDTTRLSIARLLALDVPMAWQDAVAVVHEIAMLNDVTAVMNNRPPLVGPDTCFITRTGEVELPETADTESPEAVADLLRLLLSGRDAPSALEDLAFGRHSRDLTTDLATFSVGNRRAVIARLATRALAVAEGWQSPGATVRIEPSAGDDGAEQESAFEPPIGRLGREAARPVLVKSGSARPPEAVPSGRAIVVPPPFQASPRPTAPAPVPTSVPLETAAADDREPPVAARWTSTRAAAPLPAPSAVATAQDLELRRLRQRQHDRARAARRWSPRWTLLARRMSRWIFWRPATPNPLVIGASVILVAAMASVWWRRAPSPSQAAIATSASTAERPAAVVPVPFPSVPPSNAPTGSPVVGTTPPSPGSSGASSAPSPAATSPVGSGLASVAASPPPIVRSRPTLIVRRSTPVPESPPPTTGDPLTGPAATPGTPVALAPGGERAGAPTAPATTPPAATRAASSPPVSAIPSRSPRAPVTLYSANDADVDPPVMRRQHLPSSVLEPTAEAPDDWPFLELLIDISGAVEQVRLHARQLAPGQTLYRHRMLLAAAKAWQFEPARRNGEPVRYVMRVPLEP